MSKVKAKSIENFKAAHLLYNKGMHAASVHNAYYSILQISKHILHHKCYVSYSKQKKESKNGYGSHNYIIGEIENNLTSRGEQDLFDSYDDKMSEMKRMRVLADYEDAEITKDEAQACIDYADELLTDLKECYNIL
jgi:uncharacterized protein (UPF0332 family)